MTVETLISARREHRHPELAALTALALLAGAAAAETPAAVCEPAMLVFDASGSMKGTRIAEARAATARVLPTLARQRPVGLLTYGGAEGPACGTIHLRLEPAPGNAAAIQAEIDALDPSGRTPLTEAVARAAAVLGAGTRRGLVVLVTDGEENCRGDPCALGRELKAMGAKLKVHVIGYRLRVPEGSALACLARETSGLFVEVDNTDGLARALSETLGCVPVSGVRRAALRTGSLPGRACFR
jgi:Ca-activated chloride channel family protein